MPAEKAGFPDPAVDVKPAAGKQTAVLAGGCFWCTEAVFQIVEGVDDVVSGYAAAPRRRPSTTSCPRGARATRKPF